MLNWFRARLCCTHTDLDADLANSTVKQEDWWQICLETMLE